jgi:hypothetical protein
MVNISLSEKEARELVEFYEAEYDKMYQRMTYLKGMLDKLKGAPSPAQAVAEVLAPVAAAPEEVEAEEVKPEIIGKVKKGRGKAKGKVKAAEPEPVKEEEPLKSGRVGYLRLDYEKFILTTLQEIGGLVHTNQFQDLLVSKNKLKGALVKKGEAGISRALSILKNQKNELRSIKVPGKAGLSYGLTAWFNEAGEYVKD